MAGIDLAICVAAVVGLTVVAADAATPNDSFIADAAQGIIDIGNDIARGAQDMWDGWVASISESESEEDSVNYDAMRTLAGGGTGSPGDYDPNKNDDNSIEASVSNNNQNIGSRVAQDGQQVSGRFPRTAGSNEILYRADQSGKITNYQVYDGSGNPVMRVDLLGRPHGGVQTPHVVQFEAHQAPNGQIFFKPSNVVRPALPGEIP